LGNGYGVDAKRVGAQIEALRNQQALAIATLFIRAKIVSSIDTLTRAVEARNAAAAKQDRVVDGGEGDRR
jgi:hypothetical protein